MTIKEINHREDISMRSFNVCNDNGLQDLSSILAYYKEHKTFRNIRNCGDRSDKELTSLCKKYLQLENSEASTTSKTKTLDEIVKNLTRTQREIVNSFIEINSNNLSNRSKNAIILFLNGNLKIRNISERILTNDRFNFQDIKNVGAKTVTELKSFINSIMEFIEKVAEVENENGLFALQNRFFIEKTFSISAIPIEILKSQSIFKLVDFLIDKKVIYEKNHDVIFQKAFKIYANQPEITLDGIGADLSITRERVRQLRKNVSEEIFSKFQFIKNIDDDLFQKYNIDLNQDCISVDEDLQKFINQLNNTSFSNEFISYLIYVYISENFDLIGNIEDVLLSRFSNSRNRHNWIGFYLINKTVSNVLDFTSFADDLDYRLNERIEETYNFNFKSYLLNFLKNNDSDMLSIILPIAEKIINNEFQIFIDLYDNIVFKKNTLKQIPEYAIEILERLGVPSRIEDIYNIIEKEYPGLTKNQDALRGSLQKTPEIICFGRSSTYGLKKWEYEDLNIKGGTIRNIVYEYLDTYSEPQHISDITSVVLKYRPQSNEYSIMQNLKIDESQKFVFFKNSFVGISSKNYNASFIPIDTISLVDRKTWEERLKDIQTFIDLNNRLPFSSGCPVEEYKLYRWWSIQIRKVKDQKLDEIKTNHINQVAEILSNNVLSKREVSKNSSFDELKKFVMNNKRLPSINKIDEDTLYRFFYKQRRLFEANDMSKKDEVNFIEIAKLINDYKHEN